MQIAATTVSGVSSTAAASSAATVDYESFLKLLIAQMRNQDPTQPMDSTQQIAQLASFSAVEQAVQTNARLDTLLTTSALQQAEAIIGHIVTTADGLVSGRVASVQIGAGGAAIATLEDGRMVQLQAGVILS